MNIQAYLIDIDKQFKDILRRVAALFKFEAVNIQVSLIYIDERFKDTLIQLIKYRVVNIHGD